MRVGPGAGLSDCTGLQGIGGRGAFLSPQPKQLLLPILIKSAQLLLPCCLVFTTDYMTLCGSSLSENLLCFSTKDLGQAGFVL